MEERTLHAAGADPKPRKPLGRTEEVAVARPGEVPPGTMKVVEAGGRSYILVNVGGTLHGVGRVCPHQGADLAQGGLTGAMLPCEPGEYRYGLDGQVLVCPWHRWKYDVCTGHAIFDTDARKLPTFPVRIEGDRVLMTVPMVGARRRRADSQTA